MRAVTRGEALIGVLPIENSLAGAIPETYDLLAHAPLAIVDEAVLPVPHCLVGTRGHQHRRAHAGALPPGGARAVPQVPLVDARRAARGGALHTRAAARRWPRAATSARRRSASRRSAAKNGLTVLLNDVSDHAQNYTRFVAVAGHTTLDRHNGTDWHTAVRFVTHHEPGALAAAITAAGRVRGEHELAAVTPHPWPARGTTSSTPTSRATRSTISMAEALRTLESNVAETVLPRLLPGGAAGRDRRDCPQPGTTC